MFKKWSILFFTVFLLAGCGEKAEETTTTEKTVSTIKTESATKSQVTIEQMKLSKKEKNLLEAATANEKVALTLKEGRRNHDNREDGFDHKNRVCH